MKNKRILIQSLFGGFIGYFILHPVSMLIMSFDEPSFTFEWKLLLEAFGVNHLHMSLFFVLLGMIIGIIDSYYSEKIAKITGKMEVLEGLLPICAWCKKIRDDSQTRKGEGKWVPLESYIEKRSRADFTHGMCPDCEKKQLKEIDELYAL